jgi:uncharacterized membrane protein
MPVLTVLGAIAGVVVFAILIVSVSPFWVAATIGLGVLAVAVVVDGLIQWSRVNPYKRTHAVN